MRSSVTLLATLSTLSLLAACHGATAHPPVTSGGATVTIGTARSPDSDAFLLDDHDALPAISDDGTAVAVLFHDAVDFVGTPVDTLVVWSTADGKQLARVQLAAPEPSGDDTGPADAALADDATARAAEATAALAGHRWIRTAGGVAEVRIEDDDDARRSVTLGDGRVLRADADGALTLAGAKLSPAHLPPLGTLSEGMAGASGDCGEVVGLRALAGGRAGDRWIILAPDANLGGDACFGALGVDTAAFVRIGG